MRPEVTPKLRLYDYEASPYCRRVRQALSDLELSCEIRPCPRSTVFDEGVVTSQHRFRGEAKALLASIGGQKLRFPLLVDDTSGTAVVVPESKSIVLHLWRYSNDSKGFRDVATSLQRGDERFETLSHYVPSILLATRFKNVLNLLCDDDLVAHMAATAMWPTGVLLHPNTRSTRWAELPDGIELWGHESCPDTRLVRVFLTRQQVRFTLHSQSLDKDPKVTIPGDNPMNYFLREESGREGAWHALASLLD